MTQQQLIDEGYEVGKKSFDYLYSKIEKSFDFEKVYKVMKLLDWKWWMCEDKYGIPMPDTIRNAARKLLLEVYERECATISTGGFIAGYDNGHLWLQFSIEECHSSDL